MNITNWLMHPLKEPMNLKTVGLTVLLVFIVGFLWTRTLGQITASE